MSDEFLRPRIGKIKTAVKYSGLSRTVLYELAPQNDGLFLKFGTSTLVDFSVLDQILDRLPTAKIRAAKVRTPRKNTAI